MAGPDPASRRWYCSWIVCGSLPLSRVRSLSAVWISGIWTGDGCGRISAWSCRNRTCFHARLRKISSSPCLMHRMKPRNVLRAWRPLPKVRCIRQEKAQGMKMQLFKKTQGIKEVPMKTRQNWPQSWRQDGSCRKSAGRPGSPVWMRRWSILPTAMTPLSASAA